MSLNCSTEVSDMAVLMRKLLATKLDALRYEPTAKRLRVSRGNHLVADTRDGLLVWEPKRLVPAYAVADQDISAKLAPTGHHPPEPDTPPILDPRKSFIQHTTPGIIYDVVIGDHTLPSGVFKPDDSDFKHHVLLDFAAFDWREEDEPIVCNPHDPFHRIDILHSSRHVRIELEGDLLAESSAPVLLFETLLPVRFYLPPADVAPELAHSDTVTYCAYKGQASYFSIPEKREDLAWTYHDPLREAEPIRDYVCFFDEHVDVTVDGQRMERPKTPWSD